MSINNVVLYRDPHLLVLDKPTGLLSVPGIGPAKQDCLAARVAKHFPDAKIVHRLDRDTSGVMVMALDAATHRELSRQFHDRETQKTYIAVVDGIVEKECGRIDQPMRKDLDNAPRHLIDYEHGKPALTRYDVLRRDHDSTRLQLQPITGRSHQLRLHLQSIGHPILGDDLYAPPQVIDMADRLLLHAQELTITNPPNRRRLSFESPCPF